MRQAPEGTVLEIIAVVGPTASGKTELAVDLAKRFGGEVVSADSRQVYRLLEAGTAKPLRDEGGLVEGVPYHLLDAADIREAFDAGRYERLAAAAVEAIRQRGRAPIVAGGTGLYVRALLEGLAPLPGRDERLRLEFEREAEERGRPALHARLAAVDPAAAAAIPSNNLQRLIRALEVHALTGRPISSYWTERKPSAARVLMIDWPADALRERIETRARAMWPGMLRESLALLERGFTGAEPGFQSLGYREAVRCLRGELSEEGGLAELIRSTCAYAKRQRTWFRNQTGAVLVRGASRARMLEEALLKLEARAPAIAG